MNEEQNTAVETAPVTESVTEAPESATGTETEVDTQESEAPAGVEKTDTPDDLSNKQIPKYRLDEVIQQREEAKAQIEALKKYERFKDFEGYTNEDMSSLVNFQASLAKNPELAEQIQQTIDKYNAPVNAEGEPLSETEMKIQELQKTISGMQDKVTQGMVEKNLQDYEKDFNGLVEKDFRTEGEKKLALHFTDLAMGLADKNYNQSYNKDLFNSSYNQAKEYINIVKKDIINDYIESNKKIDSPVIEAGANATQELDLSSAENRRTDAMGTFEKMAQLFNAQN